MQEKTNLSSANWKRTLSNITPLLETIVVFFIICLFNESFITAKNIQNVLLASAPMVVMASGYTLVILTGSIDLSNGTLLALTCVVTSFLMPEYGNLVLIPVILIGLVAGLVNGTLIVALKMPAFIVTLCTTQIWKCAALVISGGASKSIPKAAWIYLDWASETFLGIPLMFYAALVIWIFLVFIQKKTTIGRKIFAIGANEKAARMMGVRIKSTRIQAYLICSVSAALAGYMYALRLKSSTPTIGDSLNLLAVASVVLGGTWMSGGHGSVTRTLPASVTIMMLQIALKVVGLDAYYQEITFGLILIVAIIINSDHDRSSTIAVV
ncbi:MAG TPA: ABC transporter permease [Candidatus Pullichristensenella excrementigallinarum]|uniref:ABC transporter permease n=1 Tax=Candidatus Pullichristensenella excrementigallinarum TaxID=2840907 RepID=A0A9D1ID18_9FIRM|nr:ABC transporter permease [Candidatus Pullichristensenella excrementigallinarum]